MMLIEHINGLSRAGMVCLTMLCVLQLHAQKSSKDVLSFDVPVMVDSASTLIIPTRYNTALFTSNKLALWGDVYANIIFYNFRTDSSSRLFEKDTYIMGFNSFNRYLYANTVLKYFTNQHILYRVKNNDFNANGRIDDKDPAVLYVSGINGMDLKAITKPDENVVSYELYEKQNFALLKVQLDSDGNKSFDSDDVTFYYVKLDLNTMKLGNRINLNQPVDR